MSIRFFEQVHHCRPLFPSIASTSFEVKDALVTDKPVEGRLPELRTFTVEMQVMFELAVRHLAVMQLQRSNHLHLQSTLPRLAFIWRQIRHNLVAIFDQS